MFVPVRSRGRVSFGEGVDNRLPVGRIVDNVVDRELLIFGLASASSWAVNSRTDLEVGEVGHENREELLHVRAVSNWSIKTKR